MENVIIKTDAERNNDIIDKTINATLEEIDPDKLVPKYKNVPLQKVEPVKDFSKKSRKELFDILDQFSSDPDFNMAVLPIDYIAYRQPHLWDENIGMKLKDFLEYLELNEELQRLDKKKRLNKMEKRLRAKLIDKLNKGVIKEKDLQKKLDVYEKAKQSEK
jgi:hypothetical protein